MITLHSVSRTNCHAVAENSLTTKTKYHKLQYYRKMIHRKFRMNESESTFIKHLGREISSGFLCLLLLCMALPVAASGLKAAPNQDNTSSSPRKTYIYFVDAKGNEVHEQSMYKFNPVTKSSFTPYQVVIKDEDGNDVTSDYTLETSSVKDEWNTQYTTFITSEAQNVFKKYSVDPADDGSFYALNGDTYSQNQYNYTSDNKSIVVAYSTTNGQISGRPDDYILTVHAKVKDDFKNYYEATPEVKNYTVKGQFYNSNKDNVYQITSNQYVLHVFKRVPELVFTPDPSKTTFKSGMKLFAGNRFLPTGYFTDDLDGKNTKDSTFYRGIQTSGGFNYGFFLPDSLKYTGTEPSEGEVRLEMTWGRDELKKDNVKVLSYVYNPDGSIKRDANGNIVTRLINGTLYLSPKNWGNDSTVWSLTFHGNGKFPLYYITISHNPGSWDISAAQAATFSVNDNEGAYEVIYDNDTTAGHVNRMGKLHFIKAGKFIPGTVSKYEVPGLNITFGASTDKANTWTVERSQGKNDVKDNDNEDTEKGVTYKDFIHTPKVTLDGNKPIAGGFFKLEAITDGFLTVDAKYNDNYSYILYCPTNNETDHLDAKTGDIYGERTFRYPLIAGRTYYLYSTADQFNVHGLSFEPAFLSTENDTKAIDKATVAKRGYSELLPQLMEYKTNEEVSYKMKDYQSNNEVNSSNYAAINGSTGVISPLTGTYPHYVTILAHVNGICYNGGKQVTKTPSYKLYITDIPEYIVKKGETPKVGERISTTNIPTRIFMTMGGWKYNDAAYPYYSKTDKDQQTLLTDSWKQAKMDSVGRDNMFINGFKMYSSGAQNATDENSQTWSQTNRYSYNLPVRGDYLKFEPEENGKLFVYVLQNGLTDLAEGDDLEAKAEAKNKSVADMKFDNLRHRALYITDETGAAVDVKNQSSFWDTGNDPGKYIFEGRKTASSDHKDYYTEGLLRCKWNSHDLTFNFDGWASNYKDSTKLAEDEKKITDWWSAQNSGFVDNKQPDNDVLMLSDSSFVVPTKAYVRYSFDVISGKTYYVFQNGSKLGFCGFAFIPYKYDKKTDGKANMDLWTNYMDDKKDKDGQFTAATRANLPDCDNKIYGHEGGIRLDANSKDNAALKEKAEFVKVSIPAKNYRNHRWAGICLPFAVNEHQVHELFGDSCDVITFDSVRFASGVEHTIHFTKHVNQMIEAGRPYFIRPSWDNLADGEKKTVDFSRVSLEGVDAKTIINYNEAVKEYNDNEKNTDKIDAFTYQTIGFYNSYDMQPYSYFMSNTEDKETNKLRHWEGNEVTIPGFNVLLVPYSSDASGKDKLEVTSNTVEDPATKAKMANFWITGGEVKGGDATGIRQLVEEVNTSMTTFVKGVYTLDGQQVRATNDLRNLAPGVYVMGGKKYNVK